MFSGATGCPMSVMREGILKKSKDMGFKFPKLFGKKKTSCNNWT